MDHVRHALYQCWLNLTKNLGFMIIGSCYLTRSVSQTRVTSCSRMSNATRSNPSLTQSCRWSPTGTVKAGMSAVDFLNRIDTGVMFPKPASL